MPDGIPPQTNQNPENPVPISNPTPAPVLSPQNNTALEGLGTQKGTFENPSASQEVTHPTTKDLEKAISKVTKKLATKEKEIIQAFDRKIDEKQERTTEVLAIFITLFTFISVNITIFTKLNDIHSAVWFMLLMTACSVILVSVLILLGGQRKKERTTIVLLIICLAFLVFLLFTTKYTNWNPKINPTDQENRFSLPEKLP